jgi:hypothetical protein
MFKYLPKTLGFCIVNYLYSYYRHGELPYLIILTASQLILLTHLG